MTEEKISPEQEKKDRRTLLKKGIVATVAAAGAGATLLQASTEEAHAAQTLDPSLDVTFDTGASDTTPAVTVTRKVSGTTVSTTTIGTTNSLGSSVFVVRATSNTGTGIAVEGESTS